MIQGIPGNEDAMIGCDVNGLVGIKRGMREYMEDMVLRIQIEAGETILDFALT